MTLLVITNILKTMSGKLAREIKQSRNFSSIEEEAVLNVLKTAEALDQYMASLFKEYGLTSTQYNVLRILRGARPDGLTCSQLAERMVTRDPDITRMLDRLESLNWVQRERSKEDRRVVKTTITDAALCLIARMDEPIRGRLESTLGTMSRPALQQTVELLEQMRDALTAR